MISDFDGTMAKRDFYRIVLEHLVPEEVESFWRDYEQGNRTHFAAISAILSKIRADEPTTRLIALQYMEMDPLIGEKVPALYRSGWMTSVVSAGCNWYIRLLLRYQGLQVRERTEDESSWQPNYVRLYTNPSQFVTGSGLLMWQNERSPYFEPKTGIDKAALVRAAMNGGGRVAFAGDSAVDLDAAMLVDAEYRFARDWLADHFERQGVPFTRFELWHEVADRLISSASELVDTKDA